MAKFKSNSGTSGKSETESSETGMPIQLLNPEDRYYICAKLCPCHKRTQIVDSLGRQLKQRCATQRIQRDEEANQLVWRWKAEVGYLMTATPMPLMSAKADQGNRPSRFPLGGLRGAMKLADMEGESGKGMLRIPDVTILKTPEEECIALQIQKKLDMKKFIPVRENIETICEIKFPGDRLSRGQLKDYPKIAGRDKFQVLTLEECKCKNENRKEQPQEATQTTTATQSDTALAPNTALLPPLGGRKPPDSGTSPVPTPITTPQPGRPKLVLSRDWRPDPTPAPLTDALNDALLQAGKIFGVMRGAAMVVDGVVLIAGSIVAEVPTAGISTAGVAGGVTLVVVGAATVASNLK